MKNNSLPKKEEARKTEVIKTETLKGLNEAQVAIALYYLLANSGRTPEEIEIIGSLLENAATQHEKL